MKNSKIFLLSFLISCATLFCYAKESTKTLLFFSANWCKYCVTAKNDLNSDPALSELIKQYDVVMLDFDKDRDIITGHNIKVIPTFIVFQDGKELKRYSGYRGPSELIKFLK